MILALLLLDRGGAHAVRGRADVRHRVVQPEASLLHAPARLEDCTTCV